MISFPKFGGQRNVFNFRAFLEQRGDFRYGKAGYAAADFGHKEFQFRMGAGEFDKFIHVRLNGFNAALHGRNGIALPLQSDALTVYCTELITGDSGGTTIVLIVSICQEWYMFCRPWKRCQA